jgi:hypothetical protein
MPRHGAIAAMRGEVSDVLILGTKRRVRLNSQVPLYHRKRTFSIEVKSLPLLGVKLQSSKPYRITLAYWLRYASRLHTYAININKNTVLDEVQGVMRLEREAGHLPPTSALVKKT